VRRRCQSRCVLRRLTRLGGSHRHRPRASLCAASDAPLRFLADQDAFSKIAPCRTRFYETLHDEPDQLAVVRKMDRVLGFDVDAFRRPEIAEPLRAKIREREAARAAKQWQTADAIRGELAAQGIQLMDTADGTDWYSR
jgi:cysteinyl-tRNA synthetase